MTTVKENQLTAIAQLVDTDKVRVVTATGQSKVITAENVKDYIDTTSGYVIVIQPMVEGDFPIYDEASGDIKQSNLSQDPDGKIRASTVIIAEKGVDTIPGTITLGDALDIEGSGGQQVNLSRVTGKRYQTPYQEFDKTGSQDAFQVDVDAEVVNDVRQPDDGTVLTSPTVFNYTSPRNEILNKVYLKTNGDVTNFRYQVKSLATGSIIDSYPNKFDYAKDIGVNLVGAGIHEIDLYYAGDSTPNRYLDSQDIEITIKWDTGAFLGNASGTPYFSYDYQAFSFTDLAKGSAVPEEFTDLTDTPSDKNVPEIQNVVVNPFAQRIEYREPKIEYNTDVQISVPADGEGLYYNVGTAKWINDEPRVHSAIQADSSTNFDDWGDNPVSYLVVSDDNSVITPTPSSNRELDVIIVYNYNTEFGRYVELQARTGETINGGASYQVPAQKVAYFKFNSSNDWELAYIGDILTSLKLKSVTELNDVTDAGSGQIITDAERAKLNNLIPVSEPIVITSDLTITAANYETYNNVVVEGNKTGGTLVVDLPVISTLPSERVIFSFTNRSSDSSSMDIRAGSGDDINGAFFQRLKVGESIVLEKPSTGKSWLIVANVIDNKPCYVEDNKAVTIPVTCNNIFVKYTNFASGTEIVQPLPALNTVGSNIRLYFQNADTDKTHTVRFTPDGTETIDGASEFEIAGNIELVEFVSDVDNDNWILANLHYDESAIHSDLELDDGTTSIGSVTKITYDKASISGTSSNVTVSPQITFSESYPPYTTKVGKELSVQYPLEIQAGESDPVMNINAGAYEGQHAPSYYASLNEDVEVVGRKQTGVRTGKLWFDNIIKPEGAYISVDRNEKRIGLQEDDNLDPNITGGTAYLIFHRVAFKGTAPDNGYIQISLRDATSGDILEDSNGNLIAVRKEYKADEELGALEITAIKKYTGIEYFQMEVEENFDGEELVIEDRTEGNSCILIQALNTDDQTSRGLLQMENDAGVNIEWTSHYLGVDTFTVAYYLKQDKPITTITAGTGETDADGWHLYNWTQMKVGIASNELTLEDDGTNICGFSFGKVIGAEKTQLLRGKNLDVSITLKTPNNAYYVYGAKWTGAPDQYTKAIVTDIVNDTPVVQANWELLPNPLFCTEDITGDPNTVTGTFTVPSDSENFAVLIIPVSAQQPSKVVISDFKADTNPAFNGYFVHAPEIDGQKHLVEDEEFFECGLNTEGYASLRYTINSADTPMPAGKQIKGKADITANWSGTGGAVDFITFNEGGDASIATTFNVYPGESVPAGGTSTVNFWWSYKQGGSWTKIDESEITHTAIKNVPVPQLVTIPAFTYKAQTGDELRCFANASIDDGAYIESTSPHVYLCQTTVDFKEFKAGSADDPITTLYVKDELDNDWELTAGTDGRLRTLLVDDLPENINKHVIQTDLSGNDFDVTGDIISLVDKATKQEYTEISADTTHEDYANYIVDTTSNTVTINIPYEETRAFTVRDWKKEFDTNSCIITIRDSLDAIAHTATLDKKDKGYIFYNEGGTENDWKYGEIGKGAIIDVASDHTASTDFGDLSEENDALTCIEFKDMVCYSDVSNMGTMDKDLAHKKYVDDKLGLKYIRAYAGTNFTIDQAAGEVVIPFDNTEASSGITLSSNEFTVDSDGLYVGSVSYYANEESDPIFYSWIEICPVSTGVWELSGDMIQTKIKEDSGYTLQLDGGVGLLAGDKFRIKGLIDAPSPDKIDFETQTKTVTLGSLTQWPASCIIYKV